IRDMGGAVLVDSGLGSDTFNKVLWGYDARGEAAEPEQPEASLRAAAEWFAGRRPAGLLDLPGRPLPPATERPFTVWACAGDEWALNRQRLFFEGRGYRVGERESGMFLPLSQREARAPQMPEGLRIVPVRTAGDLAAFSEVMAANWNPPDEDVKTFYKMTEHVLLQSVGAMRLFVGLAGDVPVASGELFVSERGNIAGLHMICTRELYRKKGFGRAMTETLLAAAKEAGAGLAVLQASAEGEPVYRRAGFLPCGFFVEYVVAEEILF
ncbi:MAG TPA: GNAT family N-acetyltransferase, partial [Candidatus Bilophila faecipullorum]|nr:GNAT family N-acetyltransferase [Candidatus Bilophila faecipullorum]